MRSVVATAHSGAPYLNVPTWKESPDLGFDAKPARIEYAINERLDRTFAFDEFGPRHPPDRRLPLGRTRPPRPAAADAGVTLQRPPRAGEQRAVAAATLAAERGIALHAGTPAATRSASSAAEPALPRASAVPGPQGRRRSRRCCGGSSAAVVEPRFDHRYCTIVHGHLFGVPAGITRCPSTLPIHDCRLSVSRSVTLGRAAG